MIFQGDMVFSFLMLFCNFEIIFNLAFSMSVICLDGKNTFFGQMCERGCVGQERWESHHVMFNFQIFEVHGTHWCGLSHTYVSRNLTSHGASVIPPYASLTSSLVTNEL